MVLEPIMPLRLPCIMRLARYLCQKLPTDSSEEAYLYSCEALDRQKDNDSCHENKLTHSAWQEFKLLKTRHRIRCHSRLPQPESPPLHVHSRRGRQLIPCFLLRESACR